MNFFTSKENPDLYDKDPTVELNGIPDEANGPTPNPPTRYGRPLPEQWIPLYRKPMRTPTRKLRVVVIGGGISAMVFAHKIYHEHRLIEKGIVSDLCIYEANEKLGGTWLVNTYPGVACDVPAHIYTFPFEPNPNWSKFYASGEEILSYFHTTVDKYDLARGVKCGHRVQRAEFSESNGQWQLEVANSSGGTITDQCDVLISATGFLSSWDWPKIPGLHDFDGHLCHSASWDPSMDCENKRVAVIGNGSSGIQILPKLAGRAAHVTNFIRRPTYITPGLGSSAIGGAEQYVYTEDEKQRFRDDPDELRRYRQEIQAGSNRSFDMFVKNTEAQAAAKKSTAEQMKKKLGGDEELAAKLTPDYEVGCRRATPGPGYLESFTRDDVSLVTEGIEKIEKSGIRTEDGFLHAFDIIVCATGFNVSHRPSWPLIGRGGLALAEAWRDEPVSYLSLCASGFPNYFLFTGPNATVGHGSLVTSLGFAGDYMVQWITKMAEEDIKFVDVRPEVVAELDAYGDEIMQTFVWSGGCQSWYKNHRTDGKVTAVWSGSALGFFEMIENIRPEDFEIQYRSKNRFRFMGNGRTNLEYDPNANLGFYLKK